MHQDDDSGKGPMVVGMIGGFVAVGLVIWSAVWVFREGGVLVGIAYLIFGSPIAFQLAVWVTMIAIVPVLVVLGLMKRRE